MDKARTHMNIGFVYQKLEKTEEALDSYKKCIEI